MGPHSSPRVPVGPLHIPAWGLAWYTLALLISLPPQTSAQRRASSVPCACPAEAAPAVPATVSSAMGPTNPCAPTTGTHMTMTAGASRPSVSSSAASPPNARARVVSTVGGLRAASRLGRQSPLPVITCHLHPESCFSSLGLWATAGHSGEPWQGCCPSAGSGEVASVRDVPAAPGRMCGRGRGPWAGSLGPARQPSSPPGATLLGHTAPLEAASQSGFEGPGMGRDSAS